MSVIKSEYIDTFIVLGLRPHEAKVLVYLLEHKHGHSRDMERIMDLRQPEVCNALSSLQKRSWIKKKGEERSKQGRPVYDYMLTKKPEMILSVLREVAQKEIKRYETIMQQLKEVENGTKNEVR
jgi:predicted transcriptional regulator